MCEVGGRLPPLVLAIRRAADSLDPSTPEIQDQKPALCIGKPDEEIREIPSDAC
jgi:hypothetical protein